MTVTNHTRWGSRRGRGSISVLITDIHFSHTFLQNRNKESLFVPEQHDYRNRTDVVPLLHMIQRLQSNNKTNA